MTKPQAEGTTAQHSAVLRWAVAGRPKPGEAVSGDRSTVVELGDRWVLAVIDGLGHGPNAAAAADVASDVIDEHPTRAVSQLLELADAELNHQRGVAATVAEINSATGELSWLGVGNVDGVVLRADRTTRPRAEGVFLVSGILGDKLRHLHHPEPVQLEAGDVVIIATDGIRANLAGVANIRLPLQRLADQILADHGRPDDDALVLVAQYLPD